MIVVQTDDEYKINIPMFFNGYKVVDYIDNGSSSAVVKVQDQRSQKFFAAKIISKNDMKNKNLLKITYNEIDILRSINHPNIIKLYNSFEILNSDKEEFVVIIEEYCKNGNLVRYLNERGFKNLSEKKKIGKGILKAVQYLHEKGIAHRDIKLDNILIDDKHCPKLCDFGFSIRVKNSMNAVRWGTVGYNSPEIYSQEIIDFIKSDIWSLGITLYAMSEVELPYKSYEDAENFFLSIETNDNEIKNVVEKCTKFDPNQRPDANELFNEDFFSFCDAYLINKKLCEIQKKQGQKFKTNDLFVIDDSFKSFAVSNLKNNTSFFFKPEENKNSNLSPNFLTDLNCSEYKKCEQKTYLNDCNYECSYNCQIVHYQRKNRKHKKIRNSRNKNISKKNINKKSSSKFEKRKEKENEEEIQNIYFIRNKKGKKLIISN